MGVVMGVVGVGCGDRCGDRCVAAEVPPCWHWCVGTCDGGCDVQHQGPTAMRSTNHKPPEMEMKTKTDLEQLGALVLSSR
jgi:hypothetical protein